jgi:hypothetical protein
LTTVKKRRWFFRVFVHGLILVGWIFFFGIIHLIALHNLSVGVNVVGVAGGSIDDRCGEALLLLPPREIIATLRVDGGNNGVAIHARLGVGVGIALDGLHVARDAGSALEEIHGEVAMIVEIEALEETACLGVFGEVLW